MKKFLMIILAAGVALAIVVWFRMKGATEVQVEIGDEGEQPAA